MQIREWLTQVRAAGAEALDAELILCFVLERDRTWLFAREDEQLAGEQLAQAEALLERRLRGEPLAYLTGRREFYGREFLVDERVLVPRPESEEIIEVVKGLGLDAPQIYDIGTGSGCLAISLALEIPAAKVTAVDVSEDALAVARRNAEALGAEVDFQKGDLAQGLEILDGAVVVANLPYVDPDWQWLDKKTLDFEPALALYAANGGLELISRLIEQLEGHKKLHLILEADPCQHGKIVEFAKSHGFSLVNRRGFVLSLDKK